MFIRKNKRLSLTFLRRYFQHFEYWKFRLQPLWHIPEERYCLIWTYYIFNKPFVSSERFNFQNGAECETFVVKMSFIYMEITNTFSYQ